MKYLLEVSSFIVFLWAIDQCYIAESLGVNKKVMDRVSYEMQRISNACIGVCSVWFVFRTMDPFYYAPPEVVIMMAAFAVKVIGGSIYSRLKTFINLG